MNLDLRNGLEGLNKNGVEKRIDILMTQIEGEYKFKGNTLKDLFDFKLVKGKQETIQNSNEFKNALIEEIKSKANLGEIISNNQDELSVSKYEALANKIIEISELTREIQNGIQDLKAELLNDSFKEISLTSNSLLTKGFYSKKTLNKIDNPKNFGDNLLGLGVGTIESLAIIGKFGYDLGKGIALSPYHLIQLIRGKAKYEGNIEI